MDRGTFALIALLTLPLLPVIVGSALPAQDLPDKFQNLQVLPSDISKEDLKETMEGFTEALGVKCTFCHILEEYEKDDQEHKLVARKMIKLMQTMRKNQKEFFKDGTPETKISCWTCHRGESEIPEYTEDDDDDWI
jgi:hypothetical protein